MNYFVVFILLKDLFYELNIVFFTYYRYCFVKVDKLVLEVYGKINLT